MAEPYESPHYVCPECGGVSGEPGICQDENCSRQGERLFECRCSDGEHDEVMYSSESRTDYQGEE